MANPPNQKTFVPTHYNTELDGELKLWKLYEWGTVSFAALEEEQRKFQNLRTYLLKDIRVNHVHVYGLFVLEKDRIRIKWDAVDGWTSP